MMQRVCENIKISSILAGTNKLDNLLFRHLDYLRFSDHQCTHFQIRHFCGLKLFWWLLEFLAYIQHDNLSSDMYRGLQIYFCIFSVYFLVENWADCKQRWRPSLSVMFMYAESQKHGWIKTGYLDNMRFHIESTD